MTREEMETRRLWAAKELLRGVSQAEVARRYEVSRTTAGRWRRQLDNGELLLLRKSPGRPSRLTMRQRAKLVGIFLAGPRHFEFETDAWTSAMLQKVIKARFGVKYNRDHVTRLLQKLRGRRK